LALLKNLITTNPFVDEVDFEAQELEYFDPHAADLLGRFTELRKINLSDNFIRKLPNDLSPLAQIVELDLSGNPIDNLNLAVESLQTMPVLTSLFINLHEEEQVDYLLRSMPGLSVLNGLEVESDAIFSEEGTQEYSHIDTQKESEVQKLTEKIEEKAASESRLTTPDSNQEEGD